MQRRTIATALACAALTLAEANAQLVRDTFEPGTNADGWVAWEAAYSSIPTTGGLPLEHLRLDNVSVGPTACQDVVIRPTGAGPYAHSGNWRAAGVRQVTVDLDVRQGLYGGIFCLFIARDPGTPTNTADDCLLVLVHPDGAPSGPGWRRYTFELPAQQTTAPQGWFGEGACLNSPANTVWNNVLTDVDRMYFVLDALPGGQCQPTRWDVRVDNITVSRSQFGVAYCNGQPNSASSGARLHASGSLAVAVNDLDFNVSGLPLNSPGYFIASETPTRSTVLAGNVCVGGLVRRFSLSVQNSGGSGEVNFSPDLANPPQGAQFAPGSTWHFQYWYRDLGPTANFSDALALRFE